MRKPSLLLGAPILSVALALAACGDAGGGTTSAPPADTPPMPSLDGTSWILTGGTLDGADLRPQGMQPPTLVVADGRAGGTTGCNTYGASLILTPDGALSIAGFSVTEMGCAPEVMETESRFLAALERVDRFAWDADRLNLSNADGSASIDFVAATPPADVPLDSTVWVLTGFVDGDVATSVAAGSRLTLIVDRATGAIRGNGGCNDFGARADLDGDQIAVSEMVSTEMACQEPIMSQEAKYLQALAGAATWRIDGGVLTIATGDGRALSFEPSR